MCFICSQATGFETDIATIIGISKTPKLEVNKNTYPLPQVNNQAILTAEHLIDSDPYYLKSVDTIKNVYQNTIKYFVDIDGSSTLWGHQTDGYLNISSISIDESWNEFIKNSLTLLDSIIELDFQEVSNQEDATLKIIHTDMETIPGTGMGNAYGAASTMFSGEYYDYSLNKWRANNVNLE